MLSSTSLRVTFRSSEEFAAEFDKNLSKWGLFVPTTEIPPARATVDFVVVIPFNRRELAGRGQVMYTVDAAEAARCGGRPGVGLKVVEFDLPAAAQAREVIRETLSGVESAEKRGTLRIPARLRVRYRARDDYHDGIIRDISRGGAYLGTRKPYRVGTMIQMLLRQPADDSELLVVGEVVRTPLSAGEAGPKMGMGVRYLPMDPSRRTGMDRFVRCLELNREAHEAAEIRGSLSETGAEGAVHLFCYTGREGELEIRSAGEIGRIEFRDSRIVRAELAQAGIQGIRALHRMLTWEDGDFEYRRRSVDPTGGLNVPGERMVREGLSVRAELLEWRRKIPPESHVLPGPAHGPATVVSEPARPLLEILDLRPAVGAVLDRLGSSDLEAFRLLDELRAAGIVELG